jgi:hypothetical protein
MKRVGSGPTTLNLRLNAIIEDCLINSKGSDAVDQLDGSAAVTGSTLDLNYNLTNDAYGIFEITTANITIDSLSGFTSHFEKIILRPAIGRTITSVSLGASFVSADSQLVDNGIGVRFYKAIGNNGDYLVISKRVVNGFNVYFIEQNIILQ